MGMHSKSDKKKREIKYQEQFTRTANNKKRKEEKRIKRLEKRRNKDEKMD